MCLQRVGADPDEHPHDLLALRLLHFNTFWMGNSYYLRDAVARVRRGKMEPGDIEEMERLAGTVAKTSRCGLGQTSPNPILSSLKNFRHLYDELVEEAPEGRRRAFDLDEEVTAAAAIAGRED